MNKDERKWMHPLALRVLDGAIEGPLLDKLIDWDKASKPLLTDRAKAVLEAVEKEMKQCDEYQDCELCPLDGTDCPLGPIRDAWGGEKT